LLRRAGWALPLRVSGAAPDDLSDAAALALATGLGLLKPLGDGSTDGRGLRMEIWG
jgi:predicted RNase H-like nuclease